MLAIIIVRNAGDKCYQLENDRTLKGNGKEHDMNLKGKWKENDTMLKGKWKEL